MLQPEIADMELESSRADKLRSTANSFLGCAIFFGLVSIALAAGWYIGISAPPDKLPPNLHYGDGRISDIERVPIPKRNVVIRLTIKTPGHDATWYYDEDIHNFAPALKTLRVGNFVSASIAPDRYGHENSEAVWELRRGEEVLLSINQKIAYREDNVETMLPFAIISAVLAILLAFIGRALLYRARESAT